MRHKKYWKYWGDSFEQNRNMVALFTKFSLFHSSPPSQRHLSSFNKFCGNAWLDNYVFFEGVKFHFDAGEQVYPREEYVYFFLKTLWRVNTNSIHGFIGSLQTKNIV